MKRHASKSDVRTAVGLWWLRTLTGLVVIMVLPALIRAQSGSGSIQGRLITDDNKPIAETLVTASTALPDAPLPAPAPTPSAGGPIMTGPQVAAVRSGNDGSFVLKNLPAGRLVLCAQVSTPGQLHPCQWATKANIVSLMAGQAVTAADIVVKTGSILHVRINDPQRLLDNPAGQIPPPHLMVGIVTPQRFFQYAAPVSKDDKGRNYEITVPFDTPLDFTISSFGLSLAGENGARLDPKGYNESFTHARGNDNSRPLIFTVVGAKP